MNRRSFLQSLPVAAVATAASPSLRAQAASAACGSLAFVAPAAIDGPLARGLMPPTGQPPLPQSARYKGLRFTGRQRIYSESIGADTWYPGWAADGSLYSSYTDGGVKDAQGRPIYLQRDDSSLSEFLKVPGCEGSRWVGNAKK